MSHDNHRAAAEHSFQQSLGPLLDAAQSMPNVTDVFIDGTTIGIASNGTTARYTFDDFPGLTPKSVQAAAMAAAVFSGQEFGGQMPAMPLISVKLPPDLRVTVVRPPVGETWHLTIRFLAGRKLTVRDYVEHGVMTEAQAQQILWLVDNRKNILISGSTGAGKTTLLRALLAYAARDGQRVLVIEDTPELSVDGESVVHLHTATGVDMAALLRLTLRMSPDRIVLGEVRGPEALELVRAMNTGHDGCLATLHSNGAKEALDRLWTLVVEGQPTFPFAGVVRAIDAVVQIQGQGGKRRVSDIWLVDKAG